MDGDAKERIPHLTIFWTFFRVGLLTIGGGLAMAAVLRHELVMKKKWIDDHEFMAEMSTATLVPGAIAVNMAYLQGRKLRGKTGSLTAVLATIIPSVTIILLIALFALPYFSNPRVRAFLKGSSLAVGGQLAFAGFVFARKYLKNWRNIVVCAAGLAVAAVLKLHPVWVIIAAGALGYFLCKKDGA